MGRLAAENVFEVCDRFGRYGRRCLSGQPDTISVMRRPRLSLASRILAFQLAIILGSLLVGVAASIIFERQRLDSQYEQRALTVAKLVASMPSVREAMADSDPSRTLQPLAEGMRKASGASFVVIAGRGRARCHRFPLAGPAPEASNLRAGARRDCGVARATRGQPAWDPRGHGCYRSRRTNHPDQ